MGQHTILWIYYVLHVSKNIIVKPLCSLAPPAPSHESKGMVKYRKQIISGTEIPH